MINYTWKKHEPILHYQTQISLENEDPQRPLRPQNLKMKTPPQFLDTCIFLKLLVLFFLIDKTVQFQQIMVK